MGSDVVLSGAAWYCLQYRWHVFKSIRGAIDANEGGLEKFTQGGRALGGRAGRGRTGRGRVGWGCVAWRAARGAHSLGLLASLLPAIPSLPGQEAGKAACGAIKRRQGVSRRSGLGGKGT